MSILNKFLLALALIKQRKKLKRLEEEHAMLIKENEMLKKEWEIE